MSNWQPIETAPRDGTWFLICREGEGPESYEIGCFDPHFFDRFEAIGDDLYRKVREAVYEWRGFNNMHRATHWTPLPNPPAQGIDSPKD